MSAFWANCEVQPWLAMVVLAGALFVAAKWLTWRLADRRGTGWQRALAYWLAWPGMDAAAFLGEPADQGSRPCAGEWMLAGTKLFAGAILFWLIAPQVVEPLVRGWLGMIGIVLMLHFGVFHLLSCWWRARGILAPPLMNWPVAASSLGDFWGRRWNTAFRDLTHRLLFRPLAPLVGPRWALLTGFALSGLIHELVISIPAGAGYGGPTLYFCLQGAGLLLERWRPVRRLGQGWAGRLFTLVVVVGLAWALFHPPFVRSVVLPLMEILGAGHALPA